MKLVFLGPPGSGKGTQAKRLAATKNLPHIATGDMLRAAVKAGTEVGQKAKSLMDAGQLVTDEVVIGVFAERVKQDDCAQGFILDGFPRTLAQAKALDDTAAELGFEINHVLSFQVDDEIIVQRNLSRLTCSQCGAIFNKVTHPPKTEGQCDLCGGELSQRSDDTNEDTLRTRLKAFHDDTAALIDYYQERQLLRPIDAVGSEDEVAQRLQSAIGQ